MRVFVFMFLFWVSALCVAAPAQVIGARITESPQGSQAVFDLDKPFEYFSFALDDPPRLVVDLSNARLSSALKKKLKLETTDVRRVRTGGRDGGNLRIVLDLAASMRAETYTSNAGGKGGVRLVVDFYRNETTSASTTVHNGPPGAKKTVSSTSGAVAGAPKRTEVKPLPPATSAAGASAPKRKNAGVGGTNAKPAQVNGARIMKLPDGSQVVFDMTKPAEYHSFVLDNPHRIVVDLNDAKLGAGLKKLKLQSNDVRGVRTGIRDNGKLRIVVDLAGPMRSEAYTLSATATGGTRLVLDIFRKGQPAASSTVRAAPPKPTKAVAAAPKVKKGTGAPVRSNKTLTPVVVTTKASKPPVVAKATPKRAKPQVVTVKSSKRPEAKPLPPRRREIVVAIDPGHGGKDPGAIGPRQTREKDVVLRIAKRLQALVNKEPGMRAILTRPNDRYLHLYKRIKIARQHQADIFISIHADAYKDSTVKGSSVFILSTSGASSAAARWLAKKENDADLIGGGNLHDVDDALKPVVFDIMHDAVLADSMLLAEKTIRELRRVGSVHTSTVERAGFAVLKSPDIPSILVETAFISNPTEESKLRSSRYQQQMAEAMMKGVRAYLRKRPPQRQGRVVKR